eukprot:3483151-Pyramimonas_sp.AAC.1
MRVRVSLNAHYVGRGSCFKRVCAYCCARTLGVRRRSASSGAAPACERRHLSSCSAISSAVAALSARSLAGPS